MRYAVINRSTNEVENVIETNDAENNETHIFYQSDAVNIGDGWDGSKIIVKSKFTPEKTDAEVFGSVRDRTMAAIFALEKDQPRAVRDLLLSDDQEVKAAAKAKLLDIETKVAEQRAKLEK